jgi:hypothetical protein
MGEGNRPFFGKLSADDAARQPIGLRSGRPRHPPRVPSGALTAAALRPSTWVGYRSVAGRLAADRELAGQRVVSLTPRQLRATFALWSTSGAADFKSDPTRTSSMPSR